MKRDQISVPIDPELRALAERCAAREDRKLAAWVRRVIAQATRAAEQSERHVA
jgi:predicted HicB family RNase H-like nuclease